MQKVVIAIAIVTLLSCNSNGQKQVKPKEEKQTKSIEMTEAWATRLASGYFDTRDQGLVRTTRMGDTEGMVHVLNSLRASLDSKRNERIGSERIIFPLSYRPIWKNDKANTSEWDRRVTKIKYLSDSTVKRWKAALEATHGSATSELWVIAYLIDTESLFTNNALNINRSNQLLSRLKLLPKSAIEPLSKKLNISADWASMLLIQNDDLFDVSGNILQAKLDAAMKLLADKLSKVN